MTVNFYRMDVEVLFSRKPFVQELGGQFTFIRPNVSRRVALPAGRAVHEMPLPEELRNDNIVVEVVGEGIARTRPYYANSLSVQLVENYGQLTVTHSETGKALSKVYVKVYAKLAGGKVAFFKDGYTDLRGRFDYTSLSTNELDAVESFSILVLDDEHGAVVKEASPPKR